MAKTDEISSTEKLLDLIRDNKHSPPETAAPAARKTKLRQLKSRFRNAVSLKKPTTIGIDIGYDEIKMVKMRNISQQKHEMLDFTRIPYEPDIHPDHPDFPKFLKKSLSRFCGSGKNLELWSNISSARVELRYLRIPKVPAKQIANAVYWSHKKVAPYNESESVFDFAVLGDLVEDGSPKIAAVSFTAPSQDIQYHNGLFSKSGYALKGISIVPFAIQNLLSTGWIQPEVKTVSCLYIGRDWSRIDIFSDGRLMLSRGIKAGIKTMNEAMRGELVDAEPEENGTIELPLELFDSGEILKPSKPKEPPRSKFDTEKAQQIFFGLIHDASTDAERSQELRPEEEEVFKMILPALERLVQQVERTFEHYTQNFEGQRVEKIYVSSGIRPHRRIVDFIGDQLGLPRETFDPFATFPEFLKDVGTGPASDAERGAFTPAVGMSLSDNSRTPNFLFTYKEKAKASRSRMLNKVTTITFVVLMAICVAIYGWQETTVSRKKTELAQLKKQLEGYKTTVDQKLILDLVEQTKHKNEEFREFSRKYMGVVVLSEISNLTPSNIRLTGINVKLSTVPGEEQAAESKSLVLQGIILGTRMEMETSLAGYLLNLSNSPLFDEPVINQKEVGYYYDKEVMRFTAQLKLL